VEALGGLRLSEPPRVRRGGPHLSNRHLRHPPCTDPAAIVNMGTPAGFIIHLCYTDKTHRLHSVYK
jgi:hypothetical protein